MFVTSVTVCTLLVPPPSNVIGYSGRFKTFISFIGDIPTTDVPVLFTISKEILTGVPPCPDNPLDE